MVETAAFKQNLIQFHSYSTSPCGFGGMIFGIKYRRNTDPGFLKRYFSGRGSERLLNWSKVCGYLAGRHGEAKKYFEKSFYKD